MQLSSAATHAGDEADARARNLRERAVPTLRARPGFVAGYWTEPRDDKSFAFLVFEDEAAARAAAPAPGAAAGDHVTIEGVDFREIQANA